MMIIRLYIQAEVSVASNFGSLGSIYPQKENTQIGIGRDKKKSPIAFLLFVFIYIYLFLPDYMVSVSLIDHLT